jgi:arylsulfatase A-like enzyme
MIGRALAAAALLPLLAPAGCGAGAAPRTVVLVVLDALRADRLSQYGYTLPTSPGLDALAETATVFQRAYAPSSYTTASTATILTGQSPLRHRSELQGSKLRPEVVTLAELLSARGYASRGISFNPVISHGTGFSQGFADFVEREAGSPFNLYPDVSQGLARMREWLARPGDPTFLYLQAMNTHGPYLVPESQQSVLLGRPPHPGFRYYGSPMSDILQGRLDRRADVTPAYLQSLNERYDTAVRYTTDQLGGFFAFLRESGRFDDALIVVTADHGDELFEHGGFSHGYTLHEEVIRVPLIVKLPHQRHAGRVQEPVSLADVHPTIAEAVGAACEHPVDGHSLVSRIRDLAGSGLRAPRPLPLVANFPPRLRAYGIIEGDEKLVAIAASYEGARRQLRLYDLRSDPGEQRDLADLEPARTERLFARLSATLEHHAATTQLPETEVSDGLDVEALRALGYAQ